MKNVLFKDKKLYGLMEQSPHFIAGDMEKYFSLFKAQTDKTSYEILLGSSSDLNNKTIVDLAAGSGAFAKWLSSKIGPLGKVIAIDFNLAELKQAPELPWLLRCCARSQCLPFQSESVDKIYCHLGLMLFSPLNTSLTEIARVLKPKGQFIANLLGTSDHKVFTLFNEIASKYEKMANGFVEWGKLAPNDTKKLNSLLSTIGFNGELVEVPYTVSYTAPIEKILEVAQVFFQVHYLLSEENRQQYFFELKEQVYREIKTNVVTLEIPLIKIQTKKIS